jgi:2-oxoglutarate ferredoxin oxidoreductase subunit beta
VSHATGIRYLNAGALPHTWCPGCGIGIMLGSLVRAFEELGYTNSDTVIVTGIGCTGKADDLLSTNSLHTTHGRALAFATGIKAFNPRLHVVALMGDGDSVTIGGNHFIHAARRNIDLTAIVINNFNYGMTGGQASGTTPGGYITATTAWGNPERDFDICALAKVAGANYVARETPLNGWDLKERIKEALLKKGFSLVEVFSPCPTLFGKNNMMKQGREMLQWFQEKCIPVETYRRLASPAPDCFPTGKLVDRDAPDFNTCYEALRAKATAAKG